MAIFRRRSWISFRLAQLLVIKSNSTLPVAKVEEIGIVEKETPARYQSGQCFLHRTFAYRGVILCAWKARMMDRDDKESPKVETYYHALIDERDSDYIKIQTDLGKFLSGPHAKNYQEFRFTDTGLDQVSHKDIIPYRPTSNNPLKHKLFGNFFVVRPIKGDSIRVIVPKKALGEWKKKHLPWLYYTQIHRMTTDNIRVTSLSLFMGKKRATHWWRYCIRVENLGLEPVSIQGQRWGIYTGYGELHTIRGIGILGNLPILTRKAPAIQYCSHVTLLSARAHMWGYYLVQKNKSQRRFLCPVPSFALESSLNSNP